MSVEWFNGAAALASCCGIFLRGKLLKDERIARNLWLPYDLRSFLVNARPRYRLTPIAPQSKTGISSVPIYSAMSSRALMAKVSSGTAYHEYASMGPDLSICRQIFDAFANFRCLIMHKLRRLYEKGCSPWSIDDMPRYVSSPRIRERFGDEAPRNFE